MTWIGYAIVIGVAALTVGLVLVWALAWSVSLAVGEGWDLERERCADRERHGAGHRAR